MSWGLPKLKTITKQMTILSTMIIAITVLTWIILSSNNPINIRLLIITIARLRSIIFRLTLSSWFAFILFLIYIGGIIVIFSYFVRLSSNDSILLKIKLHYLILPLILIKERNLQTLIPVFNSCQIEKLFNNSNTIVLLLITIILLTTIIIVIKIVKINNAPLRGFNQY